MLFARFVDEAVGFLPAGSVEAFHDDLALSYRRIGVVLALPALGSVLGTVASVAADRRSRRVISSTGAVALSASLLLYAVGNSFAALCVGGFVLGLAATAMVDAAEVALVDAAGAQLRRALARSDLLASAGDLLGPVLLATVVVVGLGWQWAFVGGAVIAAAYGVWLAITPLPGPSVAGEDSEPLVSFGSIVRDRRVWRIGLISLILGPLDEPFFGFLIARVQTNGSPEWTTAVIAAGFVAGGVVALIWLVPMTASIGDARAVRLGAAAMGAAIIAVGLVPSAVMATIAGMVFGAGMALMWLALQHRTLLLVPGRPGATSAVVSLIELTGFVIPVAMGAVADQFGLGVAVLAHIALPVLAYWLAGGLDDHS